MHCSLNSVRHAPNGWSRINLHKVHCGAQGRLKILRLWACRGRVGLRWGQGSAVDVYLGRELPLTLT